MTIAIDELVKTMRDSGEDNAEIQINHAYFPIYLQSGDVTSLLQVTNSVISQYVAVKHMEMSSAYGHDCYMCALCHRALASLIQSDYCDVIQSLEKALTFGMKHTHTNSKTYLGSMAIPLVAYMQQSQLLKKYLQKILELCDKQNQLLNIMSAQSGKAFLMVHEKKLNNATSQAITILVHSVNSIIKVQQMKQNSSLIIIQLLHYLITSNKLDECMEYLNMWWKEVLSLHFDALFEPHYHIYYAMVHVTKMKTSALFSSLKLGIEMAAERHCLDATILGYTEMLKLAQEKLKTMKNWHNLSSGQKEALLDDENEEQLIEIIKNTTVKLVVAMGKANIPEDCNELPYYVLEAREIVKSQIL